YYQYVDKMRHGYSTGRGATKEVFGPRTLLAVEEKLQVVMDLDGVNVELNGVIDRVEVDQQGRAYVVDLKTGSRSVTVAEMAQLPQLGVYQAMIKAAGLQHLVDRTERAGARHCLVDPPAAAAAARVKRTSAHA